MAWYFGFPSASLEFGFPSKMSIVKSAPPPLVGQRQPPPPSVLLSPQCVEDFGLTLQAPKTTVTTSVNKLLHGEYLKCT